MTSQSISQIIEGCLKGKETARKALYEKYYSYALSVCLPYSKNQEDAREVLNDGFLKVFRHLQELKNQEMLLPWLRKIMVHTAIDRYRKAIKQPVEIAAERVVYQLEEPYLNDISVFAHLSAEDILQVLQGLPASYRIVFSLYVLEGYSHQEIAGQLNIAGSTSRFYLTEANRLLRKALTQLNKEDYVRTKR